MKDRLIEYDTFFIGILGQDESLPLNFNIDDDEDDEDEEDEEEGHARGITPFIFSKGVEAIVKTPIGDLPYDQSYVCFTDGFWVVAYTNFRLTYAEIKKLSEIDGVEYIKQLSPYRFIFCIGQLFDPADVEVEFSEYLNITKSKEVDFSDEQIVTPELEKSIRAKMKDKEFWAFQ